MLGADDVPRTDVTTVDAPIGPPSSEREHAGPRAHHQSRVGRFVILHQLGAGGMGAVFAAFDAQLDRKVALKILHNQGSTHDRQQERTLREAKALARVRHPRVVSVYEVGEAEGQVYLAMEFVDGTTLRKWQAQGPRSWREILHMYLQAGAGLDAVHQSGIVHRDFKPENVIVGRDGMPYVADFGIARLNVRQTEYAVDDAQRRSTTERGTIDPLTIDGAMLGTIGYMSPEQQAGTQVDAASDQWSFCAALYEALYGRLPIGEPPPGSAAREQQANRDGTPWLPPADSTVPLEIYRILSRGLSGEANARFPSLQALLSSLSAEYEQSAAAATLSRRTLVAVVAVACISMFLLAQYLLRHRARIVPQSALMSVVLVTATLLAGYRHRAALRRNPFHRAMWSIFLVAFLQILFVRAIWTVRTQLPAGVQIAVEMLIWSGAASQMALTLIRRMWWVVSVPLCIGTLAIVVEPTPRRLLLCGYPIVIGLLLWQWLATSRRGEGNGNNSGSTPAYPSADRSTS